MVLWGPGLASLIRAISAEELTRALTEFRLEAVQNAFDIARRPAQNGRKFRLADRVASDETLQCGRRDTESLGSELQSSLPRSTSF